MKKNHSFYMQKALEQAWRAFEVDEVPIGAIIVDAQGAIIARAYNHVQKGCSQTEHAELRVIAKAGKKQGDWRLEGCWIYVTLQPCAMCMNAIMLSRLAGLVYGPKSPLFGYGTITSELGPLVYKTDTLAIIDGICQEKSIELLQKFFKQKRKKSD